MHRISTLWNNRNGRGLKSSIDSSIVLVLFTPPVNWEQYQHSPGTIIRRAVQYIAQQQIYLRMCAYTCFYLLNFLLFIVYVFLIYIRSPACVPSSRRICMFTAFSIYFSPQLFSTASYSMTTHTTTLYSSAAVDVMYHNSWFCAQDRRLLMPSSRRFLISAFWATFHVYKMEYVYVTRLKIPFSLFSLCTFRVLAE